MERGGQLLTKTIVPEASGPNQMGSAGWKLRRSRVSRSRTSIHRVYLGPKGIWELGDEIVSVDGQPIVGLEMIESLKRTKDKPIQITVDTTPAPEPHGAAGFVRHQRRPALPRGHGKRAKYAIRSRVSPGRWSGTEQGSLLILELVQKMDSAQNCRSAPWSRSESDAPRGRP